MVDVAGSTPVSRSITKARNRLIEHLVTEVGAVLCYQKELEWLSTDTRVQRSRAVSFTR